MNLTVVLIMAVKFPYWSEQSKGIHGIYSIQSSQTIKSMWLLKKNSFQDVNKHYFNEYELLCKINVQFRTC